MKRIKNILSIIAIVLSIMGIVTFSLFILEEAFQTVMFGTWPAQDAQRWDIVKKGTVMMDKVTATMNRVNFTCGWIQPLAFISYRAYAKSADYYTAALRSKVIAHAPELFIGELITVSIKPKSWTKIGVYYVVNGQIKLLTRSKPTKETITVSGVLRKSVVSLYIVF